MPIKEPAMTRLEFREAMKTLGLTPWTAAPMIGVSGRHALRYGTGEAPIPRPVALRIRDLVREVGDTGNPARLAMPPRRKPRRRKRRSNKGKVRS